MKRINPKTGIPFKRGDRDNKGRIFKQYNKKKIVRSFFQEKWFANEEKYFRNCIYIVYSSAIKRHKHNISVDYLVSIFPPDNRCPIFGTKMKFGGNIFESPSLDRVRPNKGYVKNNVVWMSYIANKMKSNLEIEELIKIKKWAKKSEKKN